MNSDYDLVLDALHSDRRTAAELAELTGLPPHRLIVAIDGMRTGGLLQCIPGDEVTYARRQVRL